MPLSRTHNHSQMPGPPAESCAEMQVKKSVVPVERIVSVVWLRSCGDEVATVTGVKHSAWGTDEKWDGKGSVDETGPRPISLKEAGKAGWRQQTLHLYDALNPKLRQFMRRLGLNTDEIDDVIQETFLRLTVHLRKGDDEENLRPWVYMVARNLAMDVHRANRHGHEEVDLEFDPVAEPVDPNANPERAFLQKEQFRRLKVAMSQLTAQQYNSILLRSQGLRYREISEVLGTSEQRALHLVKRGLQRLMGGL